MSVKNEYAITHYSASVSAGSSQQITYFEVFGLDKWACPSKTNMPSPITQPPFQLEVAGKSLTLKCLKPQ